MAKIQKRRSRWEKLKLRYQFNMMNEENYEVKSVFSLSVMNFIVWAFTAFLLVGSVSFAVIAFTPIKHYIPGYGKVNDRRQVLQQIAMADSIENWSRQIEQKMTYIERVLSGNIDTGAIESDLFTAAYDSLKIYSSSRADSLLRFEVEQRERLSIFEDIGEDAVLSLNEMFIFPPIKGLVSDTFNLKTAHYGIDIVGTQSKDVKAILPGRVVLSEFTIGTGYVIAIQHEANLLSVYKHNSQLTRKVGTLVEQGDVIAVSGNTGELSSGPHLHFELWYNGDPLDPARYINFE